MQLSKTQVQTILDNAPKGVDKKQLLDGLVQKGYDLEGVDNNAIRKTLAQTQPVQTQQAEKPNGLLSRLDNTGTELRSTVSDALQGTGQYSNDGVVKRGLEAAAAVPTAIGKGAIDFARMIPGVGTAVDAVADVVGKGLNAATDFLSNTDVIKGAAGNQVVNPDGTTSYAQNDKTIAEKGLELAVPIGTIAGSIAGTEAAVGSINNFKNTLSSASRSLDNALITRAESIFNKSPAIQSVPGASNKIVKFLADEPDIKTATVLKETSSSKFDDYVNKAREASIDPRKVTNFDRVGDTMETVAKSFKKKMDIIGAKKAEIVKPLGRGFDPFDSSSLVNDLTSISNKLPIESRSFVKNIIEKAKNVKTKFAADKLIDEVQDTLYVAGQQNVIPKGSAIQKQVSGAMGKFNQALKDSLPKEYGALNVKWSNYKKVTDILNKALGEVVDGQSVRGGSLVKQFFSPSGKKAKVVFEYIKKETNGAVDLAQDSILAKFTMDMFDDPRAKSLLQGVPSNSKGMIDKSLEIFADKSGLAKKVQEGIRDAKITKARDFTR